MPSFMKKAISLAKKTSNTAPNPRVGAVIVCKNQIVASGYHKKAGSNHAEVEAINDALNKNINLQDCTLYVTLEPCNHFGKTPPCTQAIINAGIKRVVIGTLDINPEIAGGGASFLKENGVSVIIGEEEEFCKELIEDFVVWKTLKRPYVTLKMATTIDGKIATRNGDASWISCEKSRNEVQKLRQKSNVVLIGKNTFFNDNPKLTVRLKNIKKQPRAVVVTNKLPDVNDNLFLIKERSKETLFFTSYEEKTSINAENLRKIGCQIECFNKLEDGLKWLLANKNCYHLLCEGGGILASKLLKEDLIDEFIQYIAPISIGDEKAKNLFAENNVSSIKESDKWYIKDYGLSGVDLRLRLKPAKGK